MPLTGTEDDFAAYVARRWDALVRSALFLGCSVEEAEDIVQSTLVRSYRHWARIRSADSADAYVHRILVNVFRKARKRRWNDEVPTERLPEAHANDGASGLAARADLERVLDRLSLDQRTVLVLRYVADLSEQQVADALGIALGTVKSRTSRALAAIDRDALREEAR